MNAFQELKKVGIKSKRTHDFGEVIPISRNQKGDWFFCIMNGFHSDDERIFLPLSQLPILKETLNKYQLQDNELRLLGGRVFIGQNGVFRKK